MNPMKQTQYGTGYFNKPLYDLRGDMTQEAFGRLLGYNAHTVCRVENGISGGKLDFWQAVQKAFDIPDKDMWALMNGKETNI